MGWPQITMIGFMAVGLLAGAFMHGKPRTGNNSFITSVIGTGLQFWLLWAGGFWGQL